MTKFTDASAMSLLHFPSQTYSSLPSLHCQGWWFWGALIARMKTRIKASNVLWGWYGTCNIPEAISTGGNNRKKPASHPYALQVQGMMPAAPGGPHIPRQTAAAPAHEMRVDDLDRPVQVGRVEGRGCHVSDNCIEYLCLHCWKKLSERELLIIDVIALVASLLQPSR